MNELTWTNQVRKLKDLTPWPRNPRQIDDVQSERLGESWDEFGQVETLAIGPGNELYDGHQRLKVLAEIHGPDYEVDVRVSSRPLTEKEREKLTVMLVKASGEWDWDLLGDWDAAELVEWGFDEGELDAVDFGDEADALPAPEAQIDKAEELQEKWGVAEGDIWQAGPHYVICGDCREPETWRRLLAKSGHEKANGVFTSPPYAEQRKAQYGGTSVDEYVEWWDAVQENVKGNLADDGSFFVNIKPHCKDGERVLYVFDLVLAMRRRWGWRFVDELCWTHGGFMGSFGDRFKNQFEPIYHFCIQDQIKFSPLSVGHFSDGLPDGDRVKNSTGSGYEHATKLKSGIARPGNHLSIGASHDNIHVAAFPVALPDFFIRAYSDPGDVWLDPFLGSGTTIVAAHQADGGQRVGLGIERLPKYVSVCLERFAGPELEPQRVT